MNQSLMTLMHALRICVDCLTCEELSGGYLQEMMGLDLKTGFNLHNDIK